MAKSKRESKAVKAARRQKRSDAARKGWENHRKRAASDFSIAAALSDMFKSLEWASVTGRTQGLRTPRAKREGIKRQADVKAYKKTIPGKWDEWKRISRISQPTISIDIAPEAYDLDPSDPKTAMLFQTLEVHTSTADSEAWSKFVESGEAQAVYDYWLRTGRLLPSAAKTGARFETKVVRRSANMMISGLFSDAFLTVEAVRVLPSNEKEVKGQQVYTRKATRWVRESKAKYLKRLKQ